VYNNFMMNQKGFDWPYFHKLLKKRIESSHIPNPDVDNSYFAVTSQAVEDIAINKYDSFIKGGGFIRLGKAVGAGLFTAEEPGHMKNKREVVPAFDNDHIKRYEDQASAIVDNILSSWDGLVDVREQMKFVVFKSVMEIFFSENADEHFETIKDSIATISDGVAFNMKYDGSGQATDNVHAICKNMVNKRIESKENKNDFLDMIINSYRNGKLDFNDLYAETLSLFVGSYESTAHTLEWAIYYLATNKEWQNKISEKENLDAFIKEVLRIAPPIWNSQRIAVEDVIIDGTHVPAGTEITISSYAMHRDENVFEDPDSFKPERWLKNPKLSKGEYFPFMFGKRQCVGKEYALMQMRVVLNKIVENFNIRLLNENVHHIGGLAYRTSDPIRIYVKQK
jgi:cytochrome P450